MALLDEECQLQVARFACMPAVACRCRAAPGALADAHTTHTAWLMQRGTDANFLTKLRDKAGRLPKTPLGTLHQPSCSPVHFERSAPNLLRLAADGPPLLTSPAAAGRWFGQGGGGAGVPAGGRRLEVHAAALRRGGRVQCVWLPGEEQRLDAPGHGGAAPVFGRPIHLRAFPSRGSPGRDIAKQPFIPLL